MTKILTTKRVIGYLVILVPIILVWIKWGAFSNDMGTLILTLIGTFNCFIFEEKIYPHI